MNEPITDTVRSILDGHIILSRELAGQNHYPAIDILNSVSRVMSAITTPNHRAGASQLRDILAAYNKASDLINIGAYVEGSNPVIDRAIQLREPLIKFLRQEANDPSLFEATLRALKMLADHNTLLSKKAAN